THSRSAMSVYMFMPRVMWAWPVFRSMTRFSSSWRDGATPSDQGRITNARANVTGRRSPAKSARCSPPPVRLYFGRPFLYLAVYVIGLAGVVTECVGAPPSDQDTKF